jgi:multisubunit Na+/H+ antiporter MnhB subunit
MVGAAIAVLVSFPPPEVLLFGWSEGFRALGAAGLVIGLAFGLYTTNKKGRFQPKRRGVLAIVLLASAFLVITLRYFHIKEDAENHFPETVFEFFAIDILVGILLFLVAPAIELLKHAFGRDE